MVGSSVDTWTGVLRSIHVLLSEAVIQLHAVVFFNAPDNAGNPPAVDLDAPVTPSACHRDTDSLLHEECLIAVREEHRS